MTMMIWYKTGHLLVFQMIYLTILNAIFTLNIPKSDNIIELDATNFGEIMMNKKSTTLYLFEGYVNWCYYSKRLGPVLNELADELTMKYNHDEVKVVRLDCESEFAVKTKACRALLIKGYPTLYTIFKGEITNEYRESRTLEALDKFVESEYDKVHVDDVSDEMLGKLMAEKPQEETSFHKLKKLNPIYIKITLASFLLTFGVVFMKSNAFKSTYNLLGDLK
eukprot:NODE_409_length_7945_cov_0.205710.p2 type:complete len:222 gc:universal NODE_409_length_7945_cov_0.205710:6932-7597(+)